MNLRATVDGQAALEQVSVTRSFPAKRLPQALIEFALPPT
jgi:hypothetical protein